MRETTYFIGLIVPCLLSSLSACSHQTGAAAGRTTQAQSSVSLPPASPTPQPSPVKPAQAEQIDKTWSSQFRFATKTISEKRQSNRGYEISAEIPRIEKARTPATRRFNLWMRKKILGHLAEFRRLERSAEISDKRKKLPPLLIPESLELRYRIYYSDKRLISLRLTDTVMAMGQMHPIDYYESINYDLKKGRPLRPADIFKTRYLRLLSAYCRRELKDKYDFTYSTDPWVNEGTAPKKDNFAGWNIVPEGILISFADYQVAPHAFGKPEMIVPYSVIGKVIVKNSVTGQFLGPQRISAKHARSVLAFRACRQWKRG